MPNRAIEFHDSTSTVFKKTEGISPFVFLARTFTSPAASRAWMRVLVGFKKLCFTSAARLLVAKFPSYLAACGMATCGWGVSCFK